MKYNSAGELLVSGSGFISSSGNDAAIPYYDTYFTYYGETNNIASITYKLGQTTIATFNLNYVDGVPSTNNAKLLSMVKQ